VCLEGAQLAACAHLPKHHCAIFASRGERLAIGRKSDAVERITALECPQLALGADIPQLCGTLLAGRCEHATIRGKSDRVDGIGMPKLQKHFGRGSRRNGGRM
jgi:hypothetical protein